MALSDITTESAYVSQFYQFKRIIMGEISVNVYEKHKQWPNSELFIGID